AHLVRDDGVAGSNPATPTKLPQQNQTFLKRAIAAVSPPGQLSGQKCFTKTGRASPHSWCPNASVQSHGWPTGAAAAFMIREMSPDITSWYRVSNPNGEAAP